MVRKLTVVMECYTVSFQDTIIKSEVDMEPKLTAKTLRIGKTVTITELKMLVSHLPPSCPTPKGRGRAKDWRYCQASIFRDKRKGTWRIGDFLVCTDEWDEVLMLVIRGTNIMTQRGERKIYSSLDAIVTDLKNIAGKESSLRLLIV